MLLTATSAHAGARAVLRCASCEALFIPNLPVWPYDDFPPAFVQLYVEQGASIDLMVQPLFLLPTSSVRRYLDVGCGFGFGVDFAVHALGWDATGVEPSQLGVAGREALGIEVRREFLDERTSFPELHELVFSSEVLEHVPEPRPFLRAAARALAPGGVLMLTTPNAARLQREASLFSQVTILSYPLHAILYTRATLERLLHEVAFPFVQVFERDDTLIAMASAQPLAPVDGRLDREHFKAYLRQRLERLQPGTPVATGYAYRSFKECVNSADYVGAEQALERLQREVSLRFGNELGRLTPAPAGNAKATLAEWARVRPFNLCGCYYFQGMLALNHRGDPELAGRFFDAAQAEGERLRQVLWTIGVDDGEVEDLVRQAAIHSKIAWQRVPPSALPPSALPPSALPPEVSLAKPVAQPTEKVVEQPVKEVVEQPVKAPLEEAAKEPVQPAQGYLDAATEEGLVSGWAFDPATPSNWLAVELCLDGEPVRSTAAELYRRDLVAAKIGNGCHAFSEDLSSLLTDDRTYFVSARVRGVELKGGPLPVRGKAKRGRQSTVLPVDLKSFLHVEHDPMAVARLAQSRGRLAILVCFQPQGRVLGYHRRLLEDLKSQGFVTVLIRNGSENLERFVTSAKGLADLVLVRKNVGYDFSAWISTLALLNVELSTLSELLFLNDSVIGPLYPLHEAMTRMAAADCDFWSMTDSWAHAYHLQSYFLCFKAAALQSSALPQYLRDYPHPIDKLEVIERGEVDMSQALIAAGLRPGAYCPYLEVAEAWLRDLPRRMAEHKHAPEALAGAAPDEPLHRVLTDSATHFAHVASSLRAGLALNGTHAFWDTLIRDFRFPFVKKELLLRNPTAVPNVGDVHALLASRTQFPSAELLEVFAGPGSLRAPPLPVVLELPRSSAVDPTPRVDVLS